MGEAKRRNKYEAAVTYSEGCGISLELAKRRLKVFEVAKIKYRRAVKCPKCRGHHLTIDSTDYEYSANDHWVWCSECGFETDITKRYEPLQGFYAFDIVAAMSKDRENEFGDEWEDFASKDTIEMEREIGLKVG